MIKNILQFIVNSNGQIIDRKGSKVVAQSNYQTRIQVISPQPINNTVAANYYVYDSINKILKSFLLPTSYKGGSVINTTDPLYQLVADWNVFEVDLSETALAYI